MKKYSVILLVFAMAVLIGCQRLSPETPAKFGVSFEVSMGDAVKASSDGDGKAAHINRCILQIWKNSAIDSTIIKTYPAGTKDFSFKVFLTDPEAVYDFLFWADCGKESGEDMYYSTSSLKEVHMQAPTIGNNDAIDAFYGSVLGITIGDYRDYKLSLIRPLAQLNLITDDIAQLASLPAYESFKPVKVSFSYFACRTFDVMANSYVGEPELVNINDVSLYGESTLAMAYLFPHAGESVSTVKMTVKNANGGTVEQTFDNIPLKRNHRTNVRGSFLTVGGDFSVSVNPFFDGTY